MDPEDAAPFIEYGITELGYLHFQPLSYHAYNDYDDVCTLAELIVTPLVPAEPPTAPEQPVTVNADPDCFEMYDDCTYIARNTLEADGEDCIRDYDFTIDKAGLAGCCAVGATIGLAGGPGFAGTLCGIAALACIGHDFYVASRNVRSCKRTATLHFKSALRGCLSILRTCCNQHQCLK